MNLKELLVKLDAYFDNSDDEHIRTHDKLSSIISNLEEKQDELKQTIIEESEKNDTSEEFHDMQKELKVISKLLKKARKKQAEINAKIKKKAAENNPEDKNI
jgi:Mg2+ and Co2+ transporter CorA